MMKKSGFRLAAAALSVALAGNVAAAKTHKAPGGHESAHASAHKAGPAGGNAEDAAGTATPLPAGPAPTPDSPIADKTTPPPPTLPDFYAYVVMDAATGAVIAEAAPNLSLAPASLTKLMTAHIVFQALHAGKLRLDQTVPVSVEAWHAGGSRMFIDTTSVVNVDELLHGLIIDSGNDAAVALAEQVAGSTDSFTSEMNDQAAKLHLTATHYTNPTGLPDPDLHTTAMDVALLTRAILQMEPEILNISKEQSYTYDNITQASWNPVLAHDPTVDGLKTGLTKESGHCIDATAIRGGNRLIAVVMGGPTWHVSTGAIETLLDYGQKFFTDEKLASAGQGLGMWTNPALDAGQVAVGTPADVVVTLPVDAAGKTTLAPAYTVDASNGVTKGETVGTLSFMLDGKALAQSPLVALADAPPANFFTKLKRKIKAML